MKRPKENYRKGYPSNRLCLELEVTECRVSYSGVVRISERGASPRLPPIQFPPSHPLPLSLQVATLNPARGLERCKIELGAFLP